MPDPLAECPAPAAEYRGPAPLPVIRRVLTALCGTADTDREDFFRKVEEVAVGVRRVREEHRAQVLGQLRARGPLSRMTLAFELGLSAQTISEIMAELEGEGVVLPVGEGRSSGGRRPILYDLRTESLLAVGVHVEQTRISAVISDLSGEVHAEAAADRDLAAGQAPFVTALAAVLDRLLSTRHRGRIAGIGLGVPTTMHRSERGVFRPVAARGWTGVDLPDLLGRRYGLPVVAENRAHAVGVGEYLFGAGQDVTDQLCLVLDQGLGGAVISGGRLFSGGDGGAGALGRMTLDLSGAAGTGRVGDVVGRAAIARAARRRLRAAGRRTLGEVPIGRLDVADVIDQAQAGDPLMAEVLADVGRCLGAVVSAALCVTDSQLVLLCGTTMRAGDLVVRPLVDALAQRWPFTVPAVRLGRLGVRGGSLGAAALVLTEMVGVVTGMTPVRLGR